MYFKHYWHNWSLLFTYSRIISAWSLICLIKLIFVVHRIQSSVRNFSLSYRWNLYSIKVIYSKRFPRKTLTLLHSADCICILYLMELLIKHRVGLICWFTAKLMFFYWILLHSHQTFNTDWLVCRLLTTSHIFDWYYYSIDIFDWYYSILINQVWTTLVLSEYLTGLSPYSIYGTCFNSEDPLHQC